MENVVFMLDALADLPPSSIAGRTDIIVLDIPVIAIKKGEKERLFNRLTADSFAEVDELVQQGWITKTSMPRIYASESDKEYDVPSVEQETRKMIDSGKQVIYLAINSQISGTYQAVSALYAQLNEEYGAEQAICIDSSCASTGLALLLGDILKEYDRLGCYVDKSTIAQSIRDYVYERSKSIAMLFSWFEFEYIKNSGKVAALPAFLGKVFGIHPLGSVEYLDDGSRPLITFPDKIRGTKRFFSVLSRFISETIAEDNGIIIVAHGNCAERVQPLIQELGVYLPRATILHGQEWRCGAAIQAHGGPTSIHINYHRKPATFKESKAILHDICKR